MSLEINNTSITSSTPCKLSGKLFYFSILFFCLLAIFHSGYHLFRYNQSIQIPLVYLLNNTSLYPNDPFAATLPYYASLLWKIVAIISNSVSLELTLFILFLFEKLLLIYAAARLSHIFAAKSLLATVSSMALLAIGITPIVGSGTVVADYMEQTAFSIPFLMLAAAAFHQSKHYQWAVWMALGALSNIMYGAYALTYFGLIFVFDKDYRCEWKKWFTGLAIFLLLNIPTFVLTLSAIKRKSSDSVLWFQVVEKRFPHHLFPLEWPPLAYLKLVIFSVLVIIIAYWQRNIFPRLSKHLMYWTMAAAIWIIFAYIVAYLFKIPFLLVLHPGRATDIWYLFASLGLIAIFSNLVETQVQVFIKAIFLCAILTLFIFWQAQLNLTNLIILCSISIIALILRNILATENKNIFATGLIISTVIIISCFNFYQRFESKGGIKEALIVTPSGEQMDVALWAKNNTAKNSQFLISPDWSFFRTLSKRPVFVTIKDASAILWDRAYAKHWVERVQALGYDITQEKPGLSRMKKKSSALFNQFTDQHILKLKQKYTINYWVLPLENQTSYPILFKTAHYKVAKL